MRKSFIALAILAGAAAMLTTLAYAQDQDFLLEKHKTLKNVEIERGNASRGKALTRAARLGASAASDTLFIGHVSSGGSEPWHIGAGVYRPGKDGDYGGMWDFDDYNVEGGVATMDTMQGWIPFRAPYAWSIAIQPDYERPWYALDIGNRMNATPIQGRTPGIISAWHADNGNYSPLPNSWTPLAGSMSAWCGLRAGSDVSVVDDVAYGGTGNEINGNTLIGRPGTTAAPYYTQKNFPGYGDCWDQMLYRDVRVEDGGSLTVSFKYETQMDPRNNPSLYTRAGWFDKDPLSMGTDNFVSTERQGGEGPVDSFMVYVGVPTDPMACRYSDGSDPAPIFDLKRRWFSEVIAIDKPYTEILTTMGRDSVYRVTPFSKVVGNNLIQPMLNAQAGDDGIIRIVFRVKTNQSFSDEQNTGGSFVSTNKGAVRIDDVAITGCTPAFITTGFENAGDIDNRIEEANSGSPGPAVGEGYALGAWHATGRPPKLMAHTHPIAGGNIARAGDPPNIYPPLAFVDVCGSWDSPLRACNIDRTVMSSTDHDLLEASAGPGVDGENWGGFLSPAICTKTPADGTPNAWGIDRAHVLNNAPWNIISDQYTGVFADMYTMCNFQSFSVASWPTLQKNGARVWGDVQGTGYWWWGVSACFTYAADIKPYIYTTNAGGIPDSIKIAALRTTFFTDFGLPPATYDGHYTDNITLALSPAVAGSSDAIRAASIWTWYGDAFPFNETEVPGSAAFDTCTAYIKTSSNVAANTGDALRSVIPADSAVVIGTPADALPRRVDCVFRIFPGPGNYVIPGNTASGVRKVQAAVTPVAAAASDGSFWGAYMADPGSHSKGTHAGGWNVNTWNSVRVDTAERNLFPANSHTANASGGLNVLIVNRWSSTIEESDPHLGTVSAPILGIRKNRCFLEDIASGAPVDDRNITCSEVPLWAQASSSGFDGLQTLEYTKVFPDGLLTPGSHVEYFFRQSKLGDEAEFQMVPDTNRIFPQFSTAGANNLDARRWEDISILPDRWKEYTGLGQACMLVLDYADGRGGERVWVGISDSIGATQAVKYGAHNGWHADGSYIGANYGTNDYSDETDCGTNAGIAVWEHRGQAGSTWDLMNVRGIEDPTGSAGALGSRIANAPISKEAGKESKAGPTPEMLRGFYRMLFILTGDLSTACVGPFANVGSDDLTMLGQEFLDDEVVTRGIWVMGDGFVEGHATKTPAHTAFLGQKLGVELRDRSYYSMSNSTVLFPDMIPTSVISPTGSVYSVENSCYWTNDVLTPVSIVGAVPASRYQNLGPSENYPMYSGVYTAPGANHVGMTLVDGWDIRHLYGRGGGSTLGRLGYFIDVLVKTFKDVCTFTGAPTVEVLNPDVNAANIDFLGNVGSNPMVAGGKAIVRFGLAKADRVEVKVYDVAGRLVRTLADRTFQAGPQELTWDGTNGQGQVVSRGVYFTQVKFINSRFVGAKKVTVLK
jgi:hypothetical protein